MNTVSNIEADLTPERKQRVKDELEQSFRDPQILQLFDAVLSRQAQIQGNRNNPTVPLGPVAHGTPDVVRNYALGAETAGIYANIDGTTTAANPTQIQDAWRSLNILIEDWLQAYPVNERDVMRQRFQYLLHDEIKKVVEDKSKEYDTKKQTIDTASDTFYAEFNRVRTDALTRLSLLTNGMPLSAGGAGPVITDPPVENFTTFLNGFNRTNIVPIPATFVADFEARHTALVTYLSGFSYTRPSVTPPVDNDRLKIEALQTIAECKVPILTACNTHSSVVTANATDHNGAALDLNRFNSRVTLLKELTTSIYKPATEEIMSRDVRYQNAQVQAGTTFTLDTINLPNSFFHPRKTAVSATSYTRGTPFSADDYGTYAEWAQTNRAKVATEQADAMNENSAALVNHLNTGLAPQLTALQAQIAAGTVTVYEVKTQIRRIIGNYFGHTVATPDADLTTSGVPPLVATADQMTTAQNLLRWHFNVNSQTELVNSLSNHIIHRLNLPNTAEQASYTKNNRESYAEVAGTLGDAAEITQNRTNYLASLRAQVYETLREKYKDKDLTNPETYKEFSAEFIKLVMQARLDTLNETLKHKEKTWMSRIKEYWQDVDGMRLGITAGLAVTALASGIYLDPSFATPVITAVKSMWTAGAAFIAPHLGTGLVANTVKVIGLGASFAVGQRASRTLTNALSFNMPWSNARYRTKRQVMGTTDANGNSLNGLGDIDVSAGTYDHAEVQRALASQIAYAENKGGKFAKADSDTVNPIIGGDKSKRKLSTAQHLWAREKQGMNAIIKHRINQVATDATVLPRDKNNAMIISALDAVYAPGGMEDNFFAQIEESRRTQNIIKNVGLFGSIAAGAGLAGAFNVRF